ncbi:hypothetical protein SAMN05444392_108143 [Seinonella peptonophila]|uniref:Uncharacterized protein n=1 Tax=Seinonella peptonophila TaxID=112248 RepID=A0A1M4ZBP9_9BACL|nr:hypothetical protein [Seinonella peptonophila]SHF15202.1 hypothetical protein SAMN05444392_108143 [Seinonella peptonophila]
MTAQVKDIMRIGDINYTISAIEKPNYFFNVFDLGFSPKKFSTACYRGFKAIFAIDVNNQLILKDLYTNNGDKEPIVLNGIQPENIRHSAGDLFYKDVNLPLHYTGSILITDGFIQKYYRHMGFQSPLYYNTVVKYVFDQGIFMESIDLSEEAKKRRETDHSTYIKQRDSQNWIEKCFDISMKNKWDD